MTEENACSPLVSQPSCLLLLQSASSASSHWWRSGRLQTEKSVTVTQCAWEDVQFENNVSGCLNKCKMPVNYVHGVKFSFTSVCEYEYVCVCVCVTHQCCKHNSGCWVISHPHAGDTKLPSPQWTHWPASHRWSWQHKMVSFYTSNSRENWSKTKHYQPDVNLLALVEGLHGKLPLLQFKLHHTSQVGSVGLK